MKLNRFKNNKEKSDNFLDNNRTLIICLFIAFIAILSGVFWFVYTSMEIDNSGVRNIKISNIKEIEKSYFNTNDLDVPGLYKMTNTDEDGELISVKENYLKKSEYDKHLVYEKVTNEDGLLDLVKNENYFRKDTLDSSNKYYHRENTGKETTFTPFDQNYYLRSELDKHQLYERITEDGNNKLINAENSFWLKENYDTAKFYRRTGEENNSELTPIPGGSKLYSNEYIKNNTTREYIYPRKVAGSKEVIATFVFQILDDFRIRPRSVAITKRDFTIYDDPDKKGQDYSKTTFTLDKNSSKILYIIGSMKRRYTSDLPHIPHYATVTRDKADEPRGFIGITYSINIRFSVTVTRGDGDEITWAYNVGSENFKVSPHEAQYADTIIFNDGKNAISSVYDYSYNDSIAPTVDNYVEFRSLTSLKDLGWGNFVDRFVPE